MRRPPKTWVTLASVQTDWEPVPPGSHPHQRSLVGHEADQPDPVGDLSYAHKLTCHRPAEVNLATADADPATVRHLDCAVVIRVLGQVLDNPLILLVLLSYLLKTNSVCLCKTPKSDLMVG